MQLCCSSSHSTSLAWISTSPTSCSSHLSHTRCRALTEHFIPSTSSSLIWTSHCSLIKTSHLQLASPCSPLSRCQTDPTLRQLPVNHHWAISFHFLQTFPTSYISQGCIVPAIRWRLAMQVGCLKWPYRQWALQRVTLGSKNCTVSVWSSLISSLLTWNAFTLSRACLALNLNFSSTWPRWGPLRSLPSVSMHSKTWSSTCSSYWSKSSSSWWWHQVRGIRSRGPKLAMTIGETTVAPAVLPRLARLHQFHLNREARIRTISRSLWPRPSEILRSCKVLRNAPNS